MLPGEILLDRQPMALTSVVETDQLTAHSGRNGRFAMRSPAHESWWRQKQAGNFDMVQIWTCTEIGIVFRGRFVLPSIFSSQFWLDISHGPFPNSKETIYLAFIFNRDGKYSRS